MTNSIIYIIYETKCIVNDKIYIGVHKCTLDTIQDGYLGSGDNIKRAVKKYGSNNFIRRVLYVFSSEKQAYIKESQIVDEAFVNRSNTYNIKFGGMGGGLNFSMREKAKRTMLEKYGYEYASQIPEIQEKREFNRLETCRNKYGYSNPMQVFEIKQKNHLAKKETMLEKYGHSNASHVPELRDKHKAKLAKINHQQGSKNSQHGSMWITNGNINKKILKGTTLPQGFKPGRVV